MHERVVDRASPRDLMRGRRTVPPDVGPVIARRRLSEQLATADVTLLIGPAGYGKTTLLADWVRDCGLPSAWLTVTHADRDPVRLLTDFTESLRFPLSALYDAHPTPAPRLQSPEPPASDADLDGYVAALHDDLARIGVPIAVILDDVHVLTGAARTVQLLDAVVQGMPMNVRLLISARQVPALRVQRLQLQRRVVVIDTPTLAFTKDETAQALQAFDANADASHAIEAFDATNGWPVAVRLWAIAARNGNDSAFAGAGGSERSLTEYLTTEVLDALEPELRSFVLEACVDDSVCAELIDAVRERADSAAVLEGCYRDGLFLTVAEDDAAGAAWFTWHHVFATHARRVAEQLDAVGTRERHRRAALWWSGRDTAVAVQHALSARRPELAAELAADAWPDLVLAGHTATVVALVDDLPGDLPFEPELRLAVAFSEAARGDNARARHELALANANAGRLTDTARVRFEARSAALSLLYLVTDPAGLQETVERGRGLLRRIEEVPLAADPTTLTLTRLCVGMGEARLQQDNEAALAHLRLAAATAHERGLTGLHLVAMAETCIPTISTGQLDEAASVAEHVLESAATMGWGVPRSLAPALGYLGWYAYWRGDLESAVDRLSTTGHLLHPNDWTLIGLSAYFRAQARLHQGDTIRARADLVSMVALDGRGVMAPYWPSILAALDAELHLAEGDGAAALAWARRPPAAREYRLATTTRARILMRSGHPQSALAAVDTLPASETFINVAVLASRLRAEALFRLQRLDEAHRALQDALDAAEPFDLALPFLIDGERIRPLLDAHVREGASSDFEHRLLSRIRQAADERAGTEEGGDLTPRELATLRGLATDMTLSEIATAEFVSVNTVKSHSARLYRKLGATSRREAVRIAMARGLL